jgi:hypothetical protein
MKRLWARLISVSLLLLVVSSIPAAGQSLAEVARETKEKNEKSEGKVWTNDDLGEALPEVRLLGPPREHPPSLAPYVPSRLDRVRLMLQVANVQPDEVVIDVGSGDGRIVIMAAGEFDARGIGIELDEALVEYSRREITLRGLENRAKIIHANALDVDLSPADVVTLYLTSEGVKLLLPHLEHTLRPGTRVVCNSLKIPEWTPEPESLPEQEIWLYRVP